MQLFIILSLIIAIVAAAFAWQNPGIVAVKFMSWKFEGSIPFICFVVFAMGFLSNFFLSIASIIRYRWTLYKQKKRIQDLEDKLADKESHPIIDSH